jgi:exodeoxyribonuclease VII large subunit
VARSARADLASADERVAQRAGRLLALATTAAGRAEERLDARAARVGGLARARVREASAMVDVLAARAESFDPTRLLARGWSLTRTADGRLVRSVADATAGTELVTTLADGKVRSTVVDEGLNDR